MEKRTEVKTYKVELVCESCDKGTMESCAGVVLQSHPPQYPHRCTECGVETHISGTTYPYIGE